MNGEFGVIVEMRWERYTTDNGNFKSNGCTNNISKPFTLSQDYSREYRIMLTFRLSHT